MSPVVDGKYLQPWNVPGYAETVAAKADNRGKKARRKPAIQAEAEDETMNSVTKRRVQARKKAGPNASGNAQANAAKSLDADNRRAAQATLKDVISKGGVEDLSDLGRDEE